MDFKHLSDSELAKTTEFADADSGRKRNISADSYLTDKKNLESTGDGSTTDNNQRNDELSTCGRNHDVPTRNPKDESCTEISSASPLPTEINSIIINEFKLSENTKQDGKLLDNSDPVEDSTWIFDFGQNSTPHKTDLRISIADSVKDISDASLDSPNETGDFIMDLSPIERASESIFFDKPDGMNSSSDYYDNFLMDETSKVEDSNIYCADAEEERVVGPISSSESIRSPRRELEETQEINTQEELKERPIIDDQGVGGSTRLETSSPYSAFDAGVGDSIVGQPRCLALKQHSFANLDSLEELDFDFEFIEDEPMGGKREKTKDLMEDMFQDDDSEVEEVPIVEIEEGELTPDVHSSSQPVEGTASNPNKSKNLVESNLELFSKVNRCFFQLDKEFNNIRVPRNCKKLIGQLQDTLRIVRRMDRKLSVLIDSVNKNDRRFSRSSATCDAKATRNSPKDSGYDVPLGKKSDDKFNSPDSKSSRHRERRRGSSKSNKWEEQSKAKRRSRDKDSEESRSTRKSTPSEGKKEKQRIQSLFKRQMSLITRHVIQRNRDMKKWEVKSGKIPNKGASINRDVLSEKVKDLNEMKTLEDMEGFLQMLKEKKHRKPDDFLNSRDKQSGLKFTTRKTTNSEWRAILEKAREENKNKMAASILPCTKAIPAEKETLSRNSVEIKEHGRKMDDEISKNGKELEAENSLEEQMVKYNSNKPFDAVETVKANLSTLKNSEEQRCVHRTKEGEKERVELQNGEKVNDSLLVKRKISEEIGPIQETRVSDFESDSSEKSPKKSRKRTKKRKHSKLKSSESDSEPELKDRIPPSKKRKRARSRSSKLSPENDTPSISKSRRYHSGEEIDYFGDRSLNPQNLFIVADKNLDKHFYLTVKGNQIFLEAKARLLDEETIRPKRRRRSRKFDKEGTTLKEMEDFLQRLRSKKAQERAASPQSKEAKFLARIQAKRKAKLMACISGAPSITEKEAKVLKDLETRAREPCDSPETLRRKQKLLQKIRAETEAIVTQKKKGDPVRTLLTMMEEEEDDGSKPQILVSFPLKKSDNKQRVGEGSKAHQPLSEESQKFLNSVRAKMRAKKTSDLQGRSRKTSGDGSDLMQ